MGFLGPMSKTILWSKKIPIFDISADILYIIFLNVALKYV